MLSVIKRQMTFALNQPREIIGALPYLYEISLRRFLSRLQYYVNTDSWWCVSGKDEDNSYHLKGNVG